MQKVVGSNPISRSPRIRLYRASNGVLAPTGAALQLPPAVARASSALVRESLDQLPALLEAETDMPTERFEIRSIETGDKPLLAGTVDQSSDDAVYRRFLACGAV
jgi:hypothetical protein